jgi:hypothetical protein
MPTTNRATEAADVMVACVMLEPTVWLMNLENTLGCPKGGGLSIYLGLESSD